MKKIVVISTQRSGSTALIKALDQHPKIFMLGELFKTKDLDVIHNYKELFFKDTLKGKYLSFFNYKKG